MNQLLTAIFDAILTPFRSVPPLATLAVLSLVTGVLMLIIFRLVSDQPGIRRSKARVVSQLLAIRLFKDDPWMTVRGLGGALRENVGYLRLALFPLLVMILPVALILVHLDPWFSRRPLNAGATARVAVVLDAPAGVLQSDVRLLESEDGAYRRETPPLRIPTLREVDWRVRVERDGRHRLRFAVSDGAFTKELVAGSGFRRVTAVRSGGGLLTALLHPGEPGLAEELGIREVLVDYPERTISLLGFSMPWWLTFFILTLLFAFLLKKPLGVEA